MKIAFLGYDESRTCLIDALRAAGHAVTHIADRIDDLSAYEVAISFGYRHILAPDVLATAPRPVLNLHIAYLPYNRGAHPNFWSHIENTPSGVTIHEMDAGIDTGPIVAQRFVNFDAGETTFAETHARLLREAERLFLDNCDALLAGSYTAKPQRGRGTAHRSAQLPPDIDWDGNIEETLASLDSQSSLERDLALVDEIERVRSRNNVNWMDLLRIGLKHAPAETKAVLRRINKDDNTISELFRKLGQ